MRALFLVLIVLGIVSGGCRKNDTTAPTLTIKGVSPTYVSLNHKYTDEGATVYDDHDIDNNHINSSYHSTLNPDVNKAGIYIIIYSAIDGSGNLGKAERIVIVKNDAEFLANKYVVKDTVPGGGNTYVYEQIVSMDQAKNNRIHFSKFANYNNNTGIYADVDVTGKNITIPNQSANNIGAYPENHKFSGNGSINGQNFVINYIDSNLTKITVTNGKAYFFKE